MSGFAIAGIPFAVKAASVPPVPLLGLPVTWVLVGAFVIRFLANSARKLVPNRQRRQAIKRRKAIVSQVTNDLAAIQQGLPADDIGGTQRIQQGVLDAMASHVEAQLRDRFPGHLTASLLVAEGEHLVVVARGGGSDRAVGVRYQKDAMFCSEALTQRKTVSLGDVRRRNPEVAKEKNYKAILAVPVLGVRAQPPHFGVVTIDSEMTYVFGGRETDLGLGLSPYVGLLKLTLLPPRG